jgi:hypothetical protein
MGRRRRQDQKERANHDKTVIIARFMGEYSQRDGVFLDGTSLGGFMSALAGT